MTNVAPRLEKNNHGFSWKVRELRARPRQRFDFHDGSDYKKGSFFVDTIGK
jgi:hypothetical protein